MDEGLHVARRPAPGFEASGGVELRRQQRSASPGDIARWLLAQPSGLYSAYTVYRDYYGATEIEVRERLVNAGGLDDAGRRRVQAAAKRWRLTVKAAMALVSTLPGRTVTAHDGPAWALSRAWRDGDLDPWVAKPHCTVYAVSNEVPA